MIAGAEKFPLGVRFFYVRGRMKDFFPLEKVPEDFFLLVARAPSSPTGRDFRSGPPMPFFCFFSTGHHLFFFQNRS